MFDQLKPALTALTAASDRLLTSIFLKMFRKCNFTVTSARGKGTTLLAQVPLILRTPVEARKKPS